MKLQNAKSKNLHFSGIFPQEFTLLLSKDSPESFAGKSRAASLPQWGGVYPFPACPSSLFQWVPMSCWAAMSIRTRYSPVTEKAVPSALSWPDTF